MTDRYSAYLQVLETRDAALLQLAWLALAAVVLWQGFKMLPSQWQQRFENLFLTIGVSVFYISLIVILSQ